MLVPVEWLREFVDLDLAPEALANLLTMAGLEVDEIAVLENEPVFSTYVTPNRPDLLSVVGTAREVSALLNTEFRPPSPKFLEGKSRTADLAKITIESPVNCPRYSARVITNVKVGPSPSWIQKRLIQGGLRPINNIVDATNYVLLELGQPLHAFDYDLIANHHIIVRQARAGEKITTIDGEERLLDEAMLIIADAERPVAIAGVMGGLETEVSAKTKNVLLESAHFNPVSIRRTSKKLGMNTEASYRFERYVDPALTTYALDRVAQLTAEWAGGEICAGIIDVCPGKFATHTIELRPERANLLLGVEIPSDQMADYLSRLGLEVKHGKTLTVTIPTFRPDLRREADLIEEVGRLHGYDAIPEKLPEGETIQGSDSPQGAFASQVSEILISCGLQEVLTHTLSAQLPHEGDMVTLKNFISEDLSRLRKHLIPNLLGVIGYNASRGIRDIGVFEIGRVFEPHDDDTITERLSIAASITGSLWENTWNIDRDSSIADFFTAKGMVETLFDRLVGREPSFKQAEIAGFHPKRAAEIYIDDAKVGIIGEVSAEISEHFDLPDRTYAFELDFDELMSRQRGAEAYKPLSKFPAVTRDLAVVVSEEIEYQRVKELLVEGAGDLLERLWLFDVYKGPPLAPGHKNLAFRIVFRSADRTLRDEEIDGRITRMKELLAREVAASFRET